MDTVCTLVMILVCMIFNLVLFSSVIFSGNESNVSTKRRARARRTVRFCTTPSGECTTTIDSTHCYIVLLLLCVHTDTEFSAAGKIWLSSDTDSGTFIHRSTTSVACYNFMHMHVWSLPLF